MSSTARAGCRCASPRNRCCGSGGCTSCFFFEATEWDGEPVNKEPEKCLALEWFTVHDLPDDIIEYPAAGLKGCLNATNPLVEHAWQ
ncbi:hypothetical protein GCM10010211_82330 [Streptomyces albospinus]|uniref:DNA mismatch repair protein MutT n=1 Tax=Streptomyces albospinus TaxID=285515 RepID=A0ABQ2VNU3_9ACTN|nr:hypothetical protein GCM10010211_82330 [Streptomyces albospinus]